MRSPTLSQLKGRFRRYLVEVRSLGKDSIDDHMWTFRQFVRFAGAMHVRSARRVDLDLMYAFLEDYARGRARRSVATRRWHVGSILRFLHFVRILPRDLSREMIAPCTWSLVDVPEAFSEDDVARMLANLRTEKPRDLRDRAMMLLLIYYGLRTEEICRLRLDDIDWRRKTITVRERKNRVPLVLPLVSPLDEALEDYVERSRPPDAPSRWFFVPLHLRKRGPLNPLYINSVVRRFLRGCGLEGSARNLRHTVATRLINRGVPLETIAALLGHKSVKTTFIYTKVHLTALREVARNWSELL
jgi:integrase